MWLGWGQSAGELRRFLITGEDLGVCWSADNCGRAAGNRGAIGTLAEDENREGNSAKAPPVSAKSRTHTTMMACPRGVSRTRPIGHPAGSRNKVT
jgi:hypothetical protein